MRPRHDFPYRSEPNAELGRVNICRKCGVMRKKVGGIFHYYSAHEHLGTGIQCKPVTQGSQR